MPLVAEIIDQKAYDSGAGKTALAIQVIVYDDADPDKRPVTVPLDLTVDLDGFTNREKTEAAMRAAIAAEVTARLWERSPVSMGVLAGAPYKHFQLRPY